MYALFGPSSPPTTWIWLHSCVAHRNLSLSKSEAPGWKSSEQQGPKDDDDDENFLLDSHSSSYT